MAGSHRSISVAAAMLALLAPGIAASATDGAVGSWFVSYAKSTLDDSPEVYAEDIAKTDDGQDDTGRLGKLMAFCKDRKSGLVLITKGYWGLPLEGDRYPVAIRIDGGVAIRQAWGHSATGDTAFYPGNPATFLASLSGKSKLFLRIVDGLGRDHEATFDIDGAADVGKVIVATCPARGKSSRGVSR